MKMLERFAKAIRFLPDPLRIAAIRLTQVRLIALPKRSPEFVITCACGRRLRQKLWIGKPRFGIVRIERDLFVTRYEELS
jgi:hypothetical protein